MRRLPLHVFNVLNGVGGFCAAVLGIVVIALVLVPYWIGYLMMGEKDVGDK